MSPTQPDGLKGEIGVFLMNMMSIASPVEIFSLLLRGHSLALIPSSVKRDPIMFVKLIDEMKVNIIFACPPSLLKNTCVVVRRQGHGLETLRVVGAGSETSNLA